MNGHVHNFGAGRVDRAQNLRRLQARAKVRTIATPNTVAAPVKIAARAVEFPSTRTDRARLRTLGSAIAVHTLSRRSPS